VLSLALAGCRPAAEIGSVVEEVEGPEVAYAELEYGKGQLYYLDGEPFSGTATESHANGKPSKRYGFRAGRLHGLVREWAESGVLTVETHFRDGLRHGENTYWTPDGDLLKEQVYDAGKVVSEKHHAEH
jgi:antitoxin component YwqK of YwqJK toxin-antitoxin module